MATPEDRREAVPTIEELEAHLHSGATPPSEWKIGVEYEKPVVTKNDGESVPYEGESGIGALLGEMLSRYPWEGVYERDNLIALHDGSASITLEPGGQLEMSGQQCDSLHCAAEELAKHIAEITAVGDDLGLTFLATGLVPKTRLELAPWMPKSRYDHMRRIMAGTGTLGHRMMLQTATVQCNFDYADEADARLKFKLAMGLSPVLVAVSANSPVVDGALSGYKSYRAHVWSDTDRDRCGILPFAFDTENIFGAYTDYALDVPMYFIQRDGELVSTYDKTFRRYLEIGHGEHTATMEDWKLHLSTLFPEARLKTYLEARAADSQSSELMLATPALLKGILYDSDCAAAAWDTIAAWPMAERMELNERAAKDGLQARAGRHPLSEYARELVEISREGLVRQAAEDGDGRDESIYLDRLEEDVRAARCPADRVIELWQSEWEGQVNRLIEYCAYQPASVRDFTLPTK